MKTNEIITRVAEATRIPEWTIIGSEKKSEIADARRIAYALMRDSGMTLRDIGRAMNRAHITVYLALRNHRGFVETEPHSQYTQTYLALRESIRKTNP